MALWTSHSKKNRSDNNNRRAKTGVKNTISPYHCVEVKIPYDACEEVQELHGMRFLSGEAPLLPLPGCNQHCTCKFKHHSDRRQDDRRDAFSPGGIHFSGEKNRRLGGDRRVSSQRHVSLG